MDAGVLGRRFPAAVTVAVAEMAGAVYTGQLMAYPIGGSSGASVVTALLFAFGVWTVEMVGISLRPLPCAVCSKPAGCGDDLYPDGIARLSQSLAPAVCLLAGTGIAALLERFVPSVALRLRWAFGISIALALCAVGGLVLDVVRPYRDVETRWFQQTAGMILGRIEPGDELVIVQDRYELPSPLRWYLESQHRDARWHRRIEWPRLTAEHRNVVTVNFWKHRGTYLSVRPTSMSRQSTDDAASKRLPACAAEMGMDISRGGAPLGITGVFAKFGAGRATLLTGSPRPHWWEWPHGPSGGASSVAVEGPHHLQASVADF